MKFGDGSLLSTLVSGIHIRSNLTPPIDMPNPFAPAPDDGSNPAMTLMQPQIILDTPAGPVAINPYGVPSDFGWTLSALGLLAMGILTAYGAVRLIQTFTKGKP